MLNKMKYWKVIGYNQKPEKIENTMCFCLLTILIFGAFLNNIIDQYILDIILNLCIAIFLFFWIYNIFKAKK